MYFFSYSGGGAFFFCFWHSAFTGMIRNIGAKHREDEESYSYKMRREKSMSPHHANKRTHLQPANELQSELKCEALMRTF